MLYQQQTIIQKERVFMTTPILFGKLLVGYVKVFSQISKGRWQRNVLNHQPFLTIGQSKSKIAECRV